MKSLFIKLAIIAVMLLSACGPSAPAEPTPTLYVIPTWPPTPLPSIAAPTSIPPTAVLAVIAVTDLPSATPTLTETIVPTATYTATNLPSATPTSVAAVPAVVSTYTPVLVASPISVTPIPTLRASATILPSASATATKTVAPTLPPAPANPVISGITNRSREIYVAGKQRGNITTAFAKSGDSLTATYHFLYQIGDRAEDLGNYWNLAPAIEHFRLVLPDGANPFNRTSRAAAGGWDSVMLLDPARADPSCNGLRPFECELVQLKPAVILIMIGTNDAQQHLDSGLYEQNLRTMVQLAINKGTIPVLYTIPWNKYRDPVPFNTVITKVARAYDTPLVDYYALMEQLPNHGLSDDLVHPSEPPDSNSANFAANLGYGTTVRNLVTLQLLDALWRQVMYD